MLATSTTALAYTRLGIHCIGNGSAYYVTSLKNHSNHPSHLGLPIHEGGGGEEITGLQTNIAGGRVTYFQFDLIERKIVTAFILCLTYPSHFNIKH